MVSPIIFKRMHEELQIFSLVYTNEAYSRMGHTIVFCDHNLE